MKPWPACRAKTEQAETEKAQTQKPKASPGGTLKASPQAGVKGTSKASGGQGKTSGAGKPKGCSTSGMTKDEKDIQHVLNKVISQVSCWAYTHASINWFCVLGANRLTGGQQTGNLYCEFSNQPL